jgi:hypothetical protein
MDIMPNIVPPMTDTMYVVHHIGIEPICTADREPCQHRPAPTNRESICEHVNFQNSVVSHVAKDQLSPSTLPDDVVLFIID